LAKGEKSEYWNYYNLSYNPAADVAAQKFPMISTYNSDDWKTPDGMSDPTTTTYRYKFTIKTSNGKPSTVKVENTEEAAQADNTDTKVNMFLWYGAEGAAHRMYDKGNGIYELVCDFNSPWGFLVRTSNTSWDGGTKWGGNGTPITLGKEYPLNNSTAADLQFEDMLSLKIFAPIFGVWMPELNYGVIGNLRKNKPYQHIIASAKGWLDKGVDGFRLDAAKHKRKARPPFQDVPGKEEAKVKPDNRAENKPRPEGKSGGSKNYHHRRRHRGGKNRSGGDGPRTAE
jgi:hypothetical protein